jgi:hypothetical protein
MFFDIEWEHVFLKLRFAEHYEWLHPRGAGQHRLDEHRLGQHRLDEHRLDEHRLACYTLAMRLSLVAGPLRLLDGDFPERDGTFEIAEHNLQQALAFPHRP